MTLFPKFQIDPPAIPAIPAIPDRPNSENSENSNGAARTAQHSNSENSRNSNPPRSEPGTVETLEAVLAEACQQHGLDPAAIKAELVEAGDWPDLTAEAVRCYVRCKAQERRNLDAQPLADKLRAYGKPWPLKVDGRVVCWLVADEAAKRAHRGPEPVYSASEVETLANLPDDEAKALHALRERFAGTIREVAE